MTRRRVTNAPVEYGPHPDLLETFEEVARRYGMADPSALFGANSSEPRSPNGPTRITTGRLLIPVHGQEPDVTHSEWDAVVVRGGTLRELCNRMNHDPLRAGMPELRPRWLWLHVFNCNLRRQHLVREVGPARVAAGPDVSFDPHTVTVRYDSDPQRGQSDPLETLRLEPGSVVQVPYPLRPMVSAVDAAPNAQTCSATCGVMPEPVWLLIHQYLNPIRSATHELLSLNNRVQRLVEELNEQAGPLDVMQILTNYLTGAPHMPGEANDVAPVHRALDALAEHFQRGVVARAPQLLDSNTAIEVGRAAARLWNLLENRDFDAACVRAFQTPDVNVYLDAPAQRSGAPPHVVWAPLRHWVCGVLADAYLQLLRVPEYEERADNALAAACRRVPQEHAPARTPAALGRAAESVAALASNPDFMVPNHTGDRANLEARVFSSAAALVGTTVGNLPGPPSAYIAFEQARLMRNFTGAMRDRARANAMLTEARDRIDRVVASLGQSPQWRRPADVQRRDAFEASVLRRQLDPQWIQAQIPAGTAPDAAAARAAELNRIRARDYVEFVTDRMQTSAGWCSLMALVSFIQAYQAIAEADTSSGTKLVYTCASIFQTTVPLAAGIVGTTRMLAPGGSLAESFGALGKIAAGVGAVTGGLHLYEAVRDQGLGGRNARELLDQSVYAVQTAASVATLMTRFALVVRVGAMVSSALTLAGLVIAFVELATMDRKVQETYKTLARTFRAQPRVAAALRRDSQLESLLRALEATLQNRTTFAELAIIHDAPLYRRNVRGWLLDSLLNWEGAMGGPGGRRPSQYTQDASWRESLEANPRR